jgi:group I intron endonuclease
MVIYKITNKVNGKIYVGKTVRSLQIRWRGHCQNCNEGSSSSLHRSIRKYGKDSFSIEILDQGNSPAELNILEKLWIKKLQSYKSQIGYNLTFGGDGGLKIPGLRKCSEETKTKISRALKGKKRSKEVREKMSQTRKGRRFSEEMKIRYSLAQKARYTKMKLLGIPNPLKGRKAWNKGIPNSEETNRKIAVGNTGKVFSLERRKKLSIANKGRHHSEEAKRKIGLAHKGSFGYWNGKHLSEKTKRKISLAKRKNMFRRRK